MELFKEDGEDLSVMLKVNIDEISSSPVNDTLERLATGEDLLIFDTSRGRDPFVFILKRK